MVIIIKLKLSKDMNTIEKNELDFIFWRVGLQLMFFLFLIDFILQM